MKPGSLFAIAVALGVSDAVFAQFTMPLVTDAERLVEFSRRHMGTEVVKRARLRFLVAMRAIVRAAKNGGS